MRRACVDVGGTFTDCLVLDEQGNLSEFKVPSTPQEPSLGVLNVLRKAAGGSGESLQAFMGELDFIVHGATLATNALLTGNGAKVAMLTTRNFLDVIEIRRGFKNIRTSMYNVFVPPYRPLVPRYLRLGVEERTLYTGEILTPLSEADVEAAVRTVRAHGVEALAVCFLHSFANPTNEQRAAALCRRSLDGCYVTASHEILPIWREYERFSTTVVSAYVGPIVARYMARLEQQLAQVGFSGRMLIVQANGLVQSPEETARKAVYFIGSGPSAAPAGAVYCGGLCGYRDLISMDIGGTSVDVALIHDGQIPKTGESWVGDERVAIKMVEVASAGAGGGSIAWVDSLGLLRVGPQSAGAEPGPACYGRGGAAPTVTDADLLLGYLPADYFLGGEIPLQVELAEKAVAPLGIRLGLDTVGVAKAIFATVNSFMADQISEISTKRGHDVRDFALLAGGGAGPVHAADVAQHLGIATVLVPRFAALYSAFGMFAMDIGRDYARSYITPQERLDLEKVNRLYADMEAEALAAFQALRVPAGDVMLRRSVDMRYVGQFHEVEVEVPGGPLGAAEIQALVRAFHVRHEALYTFGMPFLGVEILTFRITASARKAPFDLREIPAGRTVPPPKRQRPCHFSGGWAETPVYDGDRLLAGNVLCGPAVIEERTTTVVIPPPFTCTVDRFKNYILKGA